MSCYKWPIRRSSKGQNITLLACAVADWHVQKSCQNSRTFLSKKVTLNLSHKLPDVEDGENTVLLLCPPVKIGNETNKTQAVTKNKSAAILAKRMHPIIQWWSWTEQRERLDANMVMKFPQFLGFSLHIATQSTLQRSLRYGCEQS